MFLVYTSAHTSPHLWQVTVACMLVAPLQLTCHTSPHLAYQVLGSIHALHTARASSRDLTPQHTSCETAHSSPCTSPLIRKLLNTSHPLCQTCHSLTPWGVSGHTMHLSTYPPSLPAPPEPLQLQPLGLPRYARGLPDPPALATASPCCCPAACCASSRCLRTQ